MRQIVLDTETTGLDPAQGHRVVELACVELANRSLTGSHLHLYLNPDRDSDPEALQVHGLTTEFLAEHPRFQEIVHRFIDYIKDAELIIHNAAFDVKFLNAELSRAGHPPIEQLCGKITDSLLHARELHPGKRNSLDALCERYGISNAHRTLHGALLDSELLAEVWLAMTRGQNALGIDATDDDSNGQSGIQRARSGLGMELPVLRASDEEIAAHDAYLTALDKAAKSGMSVWRKLEAVP